MEGAMDMNVMVGADVQDDAFLRTESFWLERVPPEMEWDESEAALIIEELVGPRVRGHA